MTLPASLLTPVEYLATERRADRRSEYFDADSIAPDEPIELPSIGCTLRLPEIYGKILL